MRKKSNKKDSIPVNSEKCSKCGRYYGDGRKVCYYCGYRGDKRGGNDVIESGCEDGKGSD
ncbi:MAG: hypothetical protein ACTSWQ_09170 [Candidatus Thorarchaeota archaeon]